MIASSECRACGEWMVNNTREVNIVQGKAAVTQECQQCLNAFAAINDQDCLEWDDRYRIEIRRFG